MKEIRFETWLIMKGNPDKSLAENMSEYMNYQFRLPDNRIIKPEGRRRTYKHFVNDFKTQTPQEQ